MQVCAVLKDITDPLLHVGLLIVAQGKALIDLVN